MTEHEGAEVVLSPDGDPRKTGYITASHTIQNGVNGTVMGPINLAAQVAPQEESGGPLSRGALLQATKNKELLIATDLSSITNILYPTQESVADLIDSVREADRRSR